MPDVLNYEYRKQALDEILGDENQARKNDSLRRYDIYQKKQMRYLRERLLREFSAETVKEMRIIGSINLGRRIVDEQASLYKKKPHRTFTSSDGKPLSEQETAQLEALYKYGCVDVSLKKSNRYFKLQSQDALQVIPKDGVIKLRVLQPHHYDVIPRDDDPSKAYAYVISVYDRSLLYNAAPLSSPVTGANFLSERNSDMINQTIADPNDDKRRNMRFIWWTDLYNFVTDGFGNLLVANGMAIQSAGPDLIKAIENPLKRLPFIDVASEKEFTFWVDQGNSAVDFALDFSVILSDTAEVNKRQSYSQAIVYSEEPPKALDVGPNRVLHMKLDPNKEVQPKFEWATPQADVAASIELLETVLRLYLSSEGIDPKAISGKSESNRYNSALERLLALLEKFEASSDDIELFAGIEQKVLELMISWSNILQGATLPGGVDPLRKELQVATVPDSAVVNVQYAKPEAVETRQDREESVVRRMENGLLSKKAALMELEGLTEEQAKQRLLEIEQDEGIGGESDGDPETQTQD